ncbi:hypothetical protein OGATHE_001668 [Ogataea polymorpha]|uniref:Uncharacterized protein n=1 Tax=Ogataea polymorpha TaxID=460523 RepID=A0A9P8PN28_9ASCO|nr:hypothetical protein OGATHE_001668 [Ogataea polymorpha]
MVILQQGALADAQKSEVPPRRVHVEIRRMGSIKGVEIRVPEALLCSQTVVLAQLVELAKIDHVLDFCVIVVHRCVTPLIKVVGRKSVFVWNRESLFVARGLVEQRLESKLKELVTFSHESGSGVRYGVVILGLLLNGQFGSDFDGGFFFGQNYLYGTVLDALVA